MLSFAILAGCSEYQYNENYSATDTPIAAAPPGHPLSSVAAECTGLDVKICSTEIITDEEGIERRTIDPDCYSPVSSSSMELDDLAQNIVDDVNEGIEGSTVYVRLHRNGSLWGDDGRLIGVVDSAEIAIMAGDTGHEIQAWERTHPNTPPYLEGFADFPGPHLYCTAETQKSDNGDLMIVHTNGYDDAAWNESVPVVTALLNDQSDPYFYYINASTESWEEQYHDEDPYDLSSADSFIYADNQLTLETANAFIGVESGLTDQINASAITYYPYAGE